MNHTEQLRADLCREKAEYESKLAAVNEDLATLSGETEGRAPVVSLAEFRNENLSDFIWLVNGSLTHGAVAMLAADAGLGKTTLLVQLSLCLSAGIDPFPGMTIPRPEPTLYIAAEGSRGAFQGRVEAARKALGISPGIGWFLQKERTTDYQIGGATLEAMVSKSKAALVILDTIGFFWSGDENSAVEWKQGVMIPLRNLTAKYGCAFMLVHHHGKESEHRKGWQRARGTIAMYADLDAFYQLDLVESEPPTPWRRLLVQTKNRFGMTGEWELEFDAGNARFK
jgi:RecA-family ATPase